MQNGHQDKGQPSEVVRLVEISRKDFPQCRPRDSNFRNEEEYENFIKPFMGQKITISAVRDASAKASGYKDYVDYFCLALVEY